MSKKKVFKGVFYGPTDGFFFQKKKVVLKNVKHFSDEKNISLSKFGPGDSVYSNMNSLFGDNKDVSITDVNGGSFLDLAVTTSKVKHVNTGAVFGSPLSSPNFTMNNNKIVFSPHLPISLDKRWINLKIIKTPVEVLIKKLFALDINFSAMESKFATAKIQFIRKLFLSINGFGRGLLLPQNLKGSSDLSLFQRSA
ncbi:hypothetical protein G9A89_010992 [Geosiphon pyriformis]|nr:hypothetical protein G9A89_010992 [Geosiphon pyriformis]